MNHANALFVQPTLAVAIVLIATAILIGWFRAGSGFVKGWAGALFILLCAIDVAMVIFMHRYSVGPRRVFLESK